MNNVIIELDKARAERFVELLKERGADDNNFMLKQVKPQLEGKCKRSMIEWHDVTEIPEDYEEILVRFRSNPDVVYVKTAVVYDIETDHPYWQFEHGWSIDDVDEWASMPE